MHPDVADRGRHLPRGERPRELLFVEGARRLSDAQLLALVLGGGQAVSRAEGVLARFGGLSGLNDALPHELRTVSGIGDAGASAICAAVELARRMGKGRLQWNRVLDNPADVADFIRTRLRGSSEERFVVLGLDARHRARLFRVVAIGSVARVDVHPREIFRPLIRSGMSACVLAHNHPSGNPSPSRADIDLTLRMIRIGRLVGIPVVDHVIVADHDSVSMAMLGLFEDCVVDPPDEHEALPTRAEAGIIDCGPEAAENPSRP